MALRMAPTMAITTAPPTPPPTTSLTMAPMSIPDTAAAASGELSAAARIWPTIPPPTAPLMASPALPRLEILQRGAGGSSAYGSRDQLNDDVGYLSVHGMPSPYGEDAAAHPYRSAAARREF